ncbi:putative DNA-binding mobile mystery protein A [Bradyrhizobium sp. S3.3.6]|uniref:mobile mystery protein A n=1 Tax=unclassified Bradyrhizobium TaxID=2631580 RepID=UPI0033923324
MGVKTIVQQQYRNIVDSAAASAAGLKAPPEGWLRTVRSALGMSGADVAKKMGVTRARVPAAERAELAGGVTLKSMQAAAEAMGCRFVYAIVPASGHVEDIITAQARKKAMAIVGTASTHMALENQKLPDDKIDQEVERLTREIAQEMPPNFWSDQ